MRAPEVAPEGGARRRPALVSRLVVIVYGNPMIGKNASARGRHGEAVGSISGVGHDAPE